MGGKFDPNRAYFLAVGRQGWSIPLEPLYAGLWSARYGSPNPLGYVLGTPSLSFLPDGPRTSAQTPNPMRFAVLSGDPQDGRRAAAALERIGARVDRLGVTTSGRA